MAKIVCNRTRRPLVEPDKFKAPAKQAPVRQQDPTPGNAGPR